MLPLGLILFLLPTLITPIGAFLSPIDDLRPRRPIPLPSKRQLEQDGQQPNSTVVLTPEQEREHINRATSGNGINYNPDGSPFLWLPDDVYAGKNFFE